MVSTGAVDPFAPQGVVWTSVSRRLVTARRLTGCLPPMLAAAAFLVAAVALPLWPLALPAAALLGASAWYYWMVGRQVPAIGYAERDDDLLVRRGIMFRSIVVVPYGRMQYVDVQAGPLDRLLGIARVQLHTASARTDAAIDGLAPAEAARLRDRLASRGESSLAGL